MVHIVTKLNPDKSETDAVLAGIIKASREAMPQGDGMQPVGFFVDDPKNGESAGGLTGYALFDWLYVEFLHVAPSLRGAGVGRELMQAAETWARERRLVGIWLQTLEFQARPFYEKLGFSVFGTIDDSPVGSRRFFLLKRFDAAAPLQQRD